MADGYKLLVGTVTYGFLPSDSATPERATQLFTLGFSADEDKKLAAVTSSCFSEAGVNPVWLAQSTSLESIGAVLVCNEDHFKEGTVRVLRLDTSPGGVAETLSVAHTGALAPACACISNDGRFVLVANGGFIQYSDGSLTSLALNDRGELEKQALSRVEFNDASNANPWRQTGPHGHCILPHPKHPHLVYAADLGSDRIRLLRLDTNGKLSLVGNTPSPAGSGPRQLAFHPEGRYLYVLYELTHEVAVWEIALPGGGLQHRCTIDLAAPDTKRNPAETPWVELSGSAIRISACGGFLYTTMRNDAWHPDGDCITVLRINYSQANEKHLEAVQYARAPAGGWHLRDLAISRDGRYVATGSLARRREVTVFSRDQKTGFLTYESRFELRDADGFVHSPSSLLWL